MTRCRRDHLSQSSPVGSYHSVKLKSLSTLGSVRSDVETFNPFETSISGEGEPTSRDHWPTEASLLPLLSDCQSVVTTFPPPTSCEYHIPLVPGACQRSLHSPENQQGSAHWSSSPSFTPEPWAQDHSTRNGRASLAEPSQQLHWQSILQPMNSDSQQLSGSKEWLSCESVLDLHGQQDAVVPQPQGLRDSRQLWASHTEQTELTDSHLEPSSGAGTATSLSALPVGHAPEWRLGTSIWSQLPDTSASHCRHSSNHTGGTADMSHRQLPNSPAAAPNLLSPRNQVSA